MVGLAETVEVLVCCVWRRIVDICVFGMSIPMSLSRVLGSSRTWIISFTEASMPVSVMGYALGSTSVW